MGARFATENRPSTQCLFHGLNGQSRAFGAYMILHIPPEEYSQYDWAKVRSINTDFIGDNLSEQRADLLFSEPYQKSRSSILVHLHLEHQSSIDKEMDVRILRYQLAIISKYVQNNADRPLICSIVMYNGEKD